MIMQDDTHQNVPVHDKLLYTEIWQSPQKIPICCHLCNLSGFLISCLVRYDIDEDVSPICHSFVDLNLVLELRYVAVHFLFFD